MRKKYTAKFKNRWGEDWIFEFDLSKYHAILKGSDVNWDPYIVVDGHAIGLILNQEEIDWLKSSWAKAIKLKEDVIRNGPNITEKK